MAQLLVVKANPNAAEHSFSLQMAKAFVETYKAENPNDEVVELDLYSMGVPLIDSDVLTAWGALREGTEFTSLTAEQQKKVGAIGALTDQFVAADKFVFVTPMWNLSVPPLMRAYIDTILVAGKTFRYTAEGPQGLMAGKPVVHLQARGGYYSDGPAASVEFGDSYLKAALGFIGLNIQDSVIAEGHAYAPDQAQAIKEAAVAKAREAAKHMAAMAPVQVG
ncbi:MAG TPA: FMN-dependent NADH-azoreductase [Bacilli bacterium]|nr:FMN-dependent NADH-azoreductase [Bacilli bacterium]